MCNTPNIKDFSAWINLFPGSPSNLIVVGQVETSGGAKQPQLSKKGEAGTTLQLTLSIRDTGGIGDTAFLFRPVRFEMPASEGQFAQVDIFWGDDVLTSLPVGKAS